MKNNIVIYFFAVSSFLLIYKNISRVFLIYVVFRINSD